MAEKGLRGAMGPVITIAILLTLFGIVIFNFYYQTREYSSGLITKDLGFLQTIFKQIDDKCRIVSFDHTKNSINFLNVGCFEGFEVGPIKLAYPKQWQGPYVEKNPSLQGVEYQIVRTKSGYFIVPGDGVILPNGKVMGKDIKIDENSDIQAMMQDEKALMHKNRPLAAQIKFSFSEFQKALLENLPDGGML
jgi:hypothetical protein